MFDTKVYDREVSGISVEKQPSSIQQKERFTMVSPLETEHHPVYY